jgi:hypothetical protein
MTDTMEVEEEFDWESGSQCSDNTSMIANDGDTEEDEEDEEDEEKEEENEETEPVKCNLQQCTYRELGQFLTQENGKKATHLEFYLPVMKLIDLQTGGIYFKIDSTGFEFLEDAIIVNPYIRLTHILAGFYDMYHPQRAKLTLEEVAGFEPTFRIVFIALNACLEWIGIRHQLWVEMGWNKLEKQRAPLLYNNWFPLHGFIRQKQEQYLDILQRRRRQLVPLHQ